MNRVSSHDFNKSHLTLFDGWSPTFHVSLIHVPYTINFTNIQCLNSQHFNCITECITKKHNDKGFDLKLDLGCYALKFHKIKTNTIVWTINHLEAVCMHSYISIIIESHFFIF